MREQSIKIQCHSPLSELMEKKIGVRSLELTNSLVKRKKMRGQSLNSE